MTNLAKKEAAPLAEAQPFFTQDQEQMILTQFLGGASKSEAMVLLEIVKRRRLDPFSRQVYFVKRWDSAKKQEVWAIQTSIDGLRCTAERTGKYDGQDEPEFGKDEHGEFCKVRVYRKDWSNNRAAVGVAYKAEFVQMTKEGRPTKFWAEKPRLMLAKCAEALAIRKAFPEDTAGLYITEEMGKDGGEEPAIEHAQTSVVPVKRTEPQLPAAQATVAVPPRAEAEPATIIEVLERAKEKTVAQKNVEKAVEILGAEVVKPTLSERRKALWVELKDRGMSAGEAATWANRHRKSAAGTDLTEADMDALEEALNPRTDKTDVPF